MEDHFTSMRPHDFSDWKKNLKQTNKKTQRNSKQQSISQNVDLKLWYENILLSWSLVSKGREEKLAKKN